MAVMRIPQKSALADNLILHLATEAKVKVVSKPAYLVLYEDINGNIPKQMKVSPIAAIPHKYKAFRSILDLSFLLKVTPRGRTPPENEKSKKMALGGAVDQIGHVLIHFIHAFSEAPEQANIFRENGISRMGFGR